MIFVIDLNGEIFSLVDEKSSTYRPMITKTGHLKLESESVRKSFTLLNALSVTVFFNRQAFSSFEKINLGVILELIVPATKAPATPKTTIFPPVDKLRKAIPELKMPQKSMKCRNLSRKMSFFREICLHRRRVSLQMLFFAFYPLFHRSIVHRPMDHRFQKLSAAAAHLFLLSSSDEEESCLILVLEFSGDEGLDTGEQYSCSFFGVRLLKFSNKKSGISPFFNIFRNFFRIAATTIFFKRFIFKGLSKISRRISCSRTFMATSGSSFLTVSKSNTEILRSSA
uniref:Uncharacterized protein n=1 Tax=Romanomermis culicivorax TaxID=13658 RepID=A0A915HFS3_ROMCU